MIHILWLAFWVQPPGLLVMMKAVSPFFRCFGDLFPLNPFGSGQLTEAVRRRPYGAYGIILSRRLLFC